MRTRTSPRPAHGVARGEPGRASDMASHLSLHAADSDQLVEDQQSSMDPIIPIHALLLGQGLIKPLLCLFKRVLCRDRECLDYPMSKVRQHAGEPHLRGASAMLARLVSALSQCHQRCHLTRLSPSVYLQLPPTPRNIPLHRYFNREKREAQRNPVTCARPQSTAKTGTQVSNPTFGALFAVRGSLVSSLVNSNQHGTQDSRGQRTGTF